MLKPHTKYPFVVNDKLYIDNLDGTCNYYQLYYEEEVCAWMLIPWETKHYTSTRKNKNNDTIAEFVFAIGLDNLKRVNDADFDELP